MVYLVEFKKNRVIALKLPIEVSLVLSDPGYSCDLRADSAHNILWRTGAARPHHLTARAFKKLITSFALDSYGPDSLSRDNRQRPWHGWAAGTQNIYAWFLPVHLSTPDVQVENFLQGRLHHEDGNSCRRSRVGHFHNTRATPKVGTSYRFKMATDSPEFFRVTCKGCTQETMLSPVPRVAFLYLLYGG